jgi:hypothetical protein
MAWQITGMSVGTAKIKLIRKDSKMLKLGYEITMLDEKSFDEIMSTVAFTRDEAKEIIDRVSDIPGVFPMVVHGMFEEN